MLKLNPKILKKKITGSAIIVALLIMTLVTILATMMTTQQQALTQRTMLILNSDRLYLYAKAVEAWAIMQLTQNIQQAKDQSQETGAGIGTTAIDIIPLSFNDITTSSGFHISGQLTDLQGKFNLNNLTNKKYEPNLVNLIMAVDPEFDPAAAKKIAQSVHDWVTNPTRNKETDQGTHGPEDQTSHNSEDKVSQNTLDSVSQNTSPNSPINKYYVKRHPPYRAAQALMASPSELRQIKGMTSGLYLRLQPFITALPRSTPININTASGPVIASLSNTIDLQTAMQIVQNRGDTPFTSMNDFLTDQTIQKANIKKSDITMSSEYFLVTAHVNIGNDKLTLKTMLYRPLKSSDTADTKSFNEQEQSSQPAVIILWESRGGI